MPDSAHTDAAQNALQLYERDGDSYWLDKAKEAIEREESRIISD